MAACPTPPHPEAARTWNRVELRPWWPFPILTTLCVATCKAGACRTHNPLQAAPTCLALRPWSALSSSSSRSRCSAARRLSLLL